MNCLFFSVYINKPRSAAAQWMANKCFSEVWTYVNLEQLTRRSHPGLQARVLKDAIFGVVLNIT